MEEILRELGTTEDGTSTRKVAAFFRRRGYQVRSFSSGYPTLLQDALEPGCPGIVRLDGDHASVVCG